MNQEQTLLIKDWIRRMLVTTKNEHMDPDEKWAESAQFKSKEMIENNVVEKTIKVNEFVLLKLDHDGFLHVRLEIKGSMSIEEMVPVNVGNDDDVQI